MNRWISTCAVALLLAAMPHAQQPVADVILSNGKIITVDERFTIAQAVAVRGRSHRGGRHQPGDARLAGPVRGASISAAGQSCPG